MSKTYQQGDARRERATDRRRARLVAVVVRLYSGGRLDFNGNERRGQVSK